MKRFLITIKGLRKRSTASKVHKGKSEPKHEESTTKRVKLRRQQLNTIKEKEKKTTNCLVITLTIQTQAICSAD